MSFWLLSALIVGPALFWIGYFYYHDRFRPEPPLMTVFAYFLGWAAAWLCLRLFDLLPSIGIPFDPEPLIGQNLVFLGYCIGIVGVIEEACKLLPFLLIIRFRAFDEEIDGIFYSSAIALGFASFENLTYVTTLKGFFLLGRSVASPLTHTIFSSIWGYAVGLACLRGKSFWLALLYGLGLSALLHGLFDFLTYSTWLRLGAAVLILVVWLWRIRVSELLTAKERLKQAKPPAES